MAGLANRVELAKHFNELGYKVGAEIGTCYGVYAEKLYRAIPGLTLFCVDNWDNAETERRERVHARSVEWHCRNHLANYRAVIIKSDSVAAATYIADGSLDFVFIDGDHSYEGVKRDIEAWTPKVRKGGIVSGHDYYRFPSGNEGVIEAVDEYAAAHGYDLQVIPWDKDNLERDDRQPCWFFVR